MTVVAIHQPQYLPWLPYFAKACQADIFVYLDNVAFQKNGVQNRNQIKSAGGPIWLTVPVHANLGTEIRDIRIASDEWRRKHIQSVVQNYARAAHIDDFHSGAKPILEQRWEYLVDLSIAVTEWMHHKLGVNCRRIRASELKAAGEGENLVLNICRELGATEYLSGKGAAAYQDPAHFEKSGIGLRYQTYRPVEYPQCHSTLGFVPDLSALDLILNCGSDSAAILRADGNTGIPA